MKNIFNLFIVLLLGLTSCSQQRTVKYTGIYADDPNAMNGLYNPERGFRLETAVDVEEDKDKVTRELDELSEKYTADSVSLSQSYFYLTNVIGKDLSEENIATMQQYFDELQKLGKKAVLRFAYERDFAGRYAQGPTLEQALQHIGQLKPFLEKNKDLILVLQAGIIGAWGEWHSSVHGLENSDEAKTAILEKLLEVAPKGMYVQIRVPSTKDLLKNKPELYNRISFHDDMIIIKPHKWDGEMHEGTANFERIVKESPYLPVDGELPWGFWSINNDADSPDPGWLVDGPQAARRFFLQHFTSLSVIHNYLEIRGRNNIDSVKYSMQVWKETPITEAFLKENKMPISANYFEKKDGTKVERNTFDYIRDHLGYRIELQELHRDNDLVIGKENNISLNLINRGFSTLFNNHEVNFVLIGEDGKVYEFKTNTDVNTWQPYNPNDANCTPIIHNIQTKLLPPQDIAKGTYKLGLWIADGSERLKYNHRYAIRCANGNVAWWISKDGKYGVNILDEVKL